MRNLLERERCARKILDGETVTSAQVLEAFGYEITIDIKRRQRCRAPNVRHWQAVPDVARSVDSALYFFSNEEKKDRILQATEQLAHLEPFGWENNSLALALCVVALRGTPSGILVGRWLYD
jgi:hypothetical protein